MSDFFSQVFTSDGFSAAYSRKLRPQSREQRVAEYEANKASFTAAKGNTLHTFLTGEQSAPDAAAQGLDANPLTREQYREQLASLPREQRKVIEEALLDVELNNGELTDAPAAEYADDEYE